MSPEQEIQQLEETKTEILRFMNELDEKLANQEIDQITYRATLHDKFLGKTKEDLLDYIDRHIRIAGNSVSETGVQKTSRKPGTNTIIITAMLLILVTTITIIYLSPNTLIGFTVGTREITRTTALDKAFDHYTETQLEFNRVTSLKISGSLEGTRAVVKLRVNGTDYLVAEIVKPEQDQITGLAIGQEASPYTLTTNKSVYALGETVTITLTPETSNQSLYIIYDEEMQKLENNIYTPQNPGEYQVVALVVIENNIIRLETNFTVTDEVLPIETINQTENESNQIITPIEPEITAFTFTGLCVKTCSLPETTNPLLIVELDGNSTLNITTITITQKKDNEAPVQTSNLPDITLLTGQTTQINLNNYFTDPDGDTVQYDINEIPEISSAITQNILALSGTTPGIYTAYIYATDGDKLTTSNTFQIIITEISEPTNGTNQTNETQQPISSPSTLTDCSDPNPNNRPASCIEGNEEDYFKKQSIRLQNLDRTPIARITSYGNLVIRGSLIENSQGTPGPRDFRVGYTLPESEIEVITAWIDSKTGSLHLKGWLYEEHLELQPEGSVYLIQNRKGTNLGYFDRNTGDLYLRGNLITGRSSEDITTE
jgi:hypothetical protein